LRQDRAIAPAPISPLPVLRDCRILPAPSPGMTIQAIQAYVRSVFDPAGGILAALTHHSMLALQACMIRIRAFGISAFDAPFGGTGLSGMDREGGRKGIRNDLDVKSSQMVWA
jgi:hypothetical protein